MAKHKMSICSDCNGTCELVTSHRFLCYGCTSGILFNEKQIPEGQIPTNGGYALEKQCCKDNRHTRITYWKNRLEQERKLSEELAAAKEKVIYTQKLLGSLYGSNPAG